jgi:hypothetical protein
MKIPASAKRRTADVLIVVEKLIIRCFAKSIVEIIPKIRKNIPKKDKTVIPTQLLQLFIKLFPFQPGVAILIIANRSATHATTTAHSQI